MGIASGAAAPCERRTAHTGFALPVPASALRVGSSGQTFEAIQTASQRQRRPKKAGLQQGSQVKSAHLRIQRIRSGSLEPVRFDCADQDAVGDRE